MKSYKELKALKEVFQMQIVRPKIYEIYKTLEEVFCIFKEFISTAILNPGSLLACGIIR